MNHEFNIFRHILSYQRKQKKLLTPRKIKTSDVINYLILQLSVSRKQLHTYKNVIMR